MDEARARLEAYLRDGMSAYGGSINWLLRDLALLAVGDGALAKKGKK